MAWRRTGDKPLSEPMVSLPTHTCVTRPQWLKPFHKNNTGTTRTGSRFHINTAFYWCMVSTKGTSLTSKNSWSSYHVKDEIVSQRHWVESKQYQVNSRQEFMDPVQYEMSHRYGNFCSGVKAVLRPSLVRNVVSDVDENVMRHTGMDSLYWTIYICITSRSCMH